MTHHVYDLTYIDFELLKVRVWEQHCASRHTKAVSRTAFEAWGKVAALLDAALHNARITSTSDKYYVMVSSGGLYDTLWEQFTHLPPACTRKSEVCPTAYFNELLTALSDAAGYAVKLEADEGNPTNKRDVPVMVRPALEK